MASCVWSVWTNRLPCTVFKIWCFKDFGITILTFWGHVTDRSRKYGTRNMQFPIGSQFEPTVYLARFFYSGVTNLLWPFRITYSVIAHMTAVSQYTVSYRWSASADGRRLSYLALEFFYLFLSILVGNCPHRITDLTENNPVGITPRCLMGKIVG